MNFEQITSEGGGSDGGGVGRGFRRHKGRAGGLTCRISFVKPINNSNFCPINKKNRTAREL